MKIDSYTDTKRLRSYRGIYVYYNSDFGMYKATTKKLGDIVADSEKGIMRLIDIEYEIDEMGMLTWVLNETEE